MPDFLQPRAIIFVRVSVAALVFWLISLFVKKEKVQPKHLFMMALSAVFGVAINQIMFFEGLNLTTPINASIIMVGVPIAVLIFSQLINKEKITIFKAIGILFGTAGAVILILNSGSIDLKPGNFLGNMFIVVNATSYALYLVLIKPMMKIYRPLTVMRWVFLFGFIYIFIFTFPVARQSDWSLIPVNIWFSIAYVVFFTTILAYFLNNYSLTKISPAANSSFIYLQPIFATVIALAFSKDELSFLEVFAALLIFVGVYFVIRKKGADWRTIRFKKTN